MGMVIEDMGGLAAWWQQGAGPVAVCDGVFDLFHWGHLQHLEAASKIADRLLVLVAADNHVQKGPGRPVYNQRERAALVAGLQCVDAALVVDSSDIMAVLGQFKPRYYVKGADYQHKGSRTQDSIRKLMASYGGEVVYTDTPLQSSSSIANEHLPVFSLSQQDFLKLVKTEHSYSDIATLLDRVQGLRVRVEGDPIIDRYIFVRPEGKSAKETLVTFSQLQQQDYRGGALVLGDHIKALGTEVCPVSAESAIVKTRYVTEDFRQKVFSVAYLNPAVDGGNRTRDLPIGRWDMSLVGDFGHGRFPKPVTFAENCLSKWTALTVQSNSLNWGFNLLTKWPRADYVAIDEPELRLAASDKDSPVTELAERQIERMGCQRFVVTLGHRGSLVWDGQWTKCPPFADRVVDRMGAGDAYLAVTAPLAYLGACGPVMALVGSLAAAQAVATLGNIPVDLDNLKKALRTVLA